MNYKNHINAVEIEKNNNTRHFGGYETSDGRKVIKTKLIRSANPGEFTDNDIAFLKQVYNLKYIVDFRNKQEIEEKPSLTSVPDVQYIHLPLINDLGRNNPIETDKKSVHDNILLTLYNLLGGTSESAIKYMANVYSSIVTDKYSINMARKFFDILSENENGCVLYHCAGGKDRTGVISAVLLSCLGVSWDKVMEDYLLTNLYTADEINRQIEGVLAVTDDPDVVYGLRSIIGVNPGIMEEVQKIIMERYSTIENYLNEALLLTVNKIKKLRSVYTK